MTDRLLIAAGSPRGRVTIVRGRGLGGSSASAPPPPPPPPPPTTTAVEYEPTVFTGDSITFNGSSFAKKYAASHPVHPGKTISVLSENSRVVGQIANLNDGGNSLIGHLADAVATGANLAGGMIGANDMAASRTAAQHRDDLKVLYAEYKKAKADLDVFWIAPTPYNSNEAHPNYSNFTTQRNALLADCRDPAVHGQWCDYYCPIGEHPSFKGTNSAFFSDSVHLNIAGYAELEPGFRAFMDTLFDTSREVSTVIYDNAWPGDQTGLEPSSERTVRFILSGLAWAGTNVDIAVAGATGSPQVRLNGGAYGTNLSQRMFNGDVIDLKVTTASASSSTRSINLTINGETRAIAFTTAAASPYNATVFSGTRKSANTNLSNNNLTFAGTDFGSTYPVRGAGAVPLSTPNGYVEFTTAPKANGYTTMLAGLVDASYAFSGVVMLGQQAGSMSFHWEGIYYLGNSTVVNLPGSSWSGGPKTIGLLAFQTGQVFLRTANGWFPQAPVVKPDGTLDTTATPGIQTGLENISFAVGGTDDSAFTLNAGKAPFAFALPANAQLGWR